MASIIGWIFTKLINDIIRFIRSHELLGLFSLFYLIYNLNGRTIGSGDTIPASLLPFSMLENHNLYFDNFYPHYANAFVSGTYFFVHVSGHYLSLFPIVTPILITPLYVIPYLLLKLNHVPIDLTNLGFRFMILIMEKLSASFIAALAGIFVFLSLKELINRKTALIGAMIFAFATDTWTISSQGLWQHGLVELFLAMSIYLVLLNEKQKSDKIIISLGILSGLFVFNRPADSILLIPVLYYIMKLKYRRIVYYFGSMALFGGPVLLYNYHYFGNLFGGYGTILSGFSLNPNNMISFVGLLISPSRGLFVYTPILILSVFGYIFKTLQIENKNIRNFLLIFGFSILISLLVYSSWERSWWAGWSYGPRFLTGMLPALIMFLGLFIKDISLKIKNRKNLLVICIFSILLIWSVFAQLVGAFYYPNGNWDGESNVEHHPEKLWDWKDTQITRTFNAGIIPPRNYIKALQTIANPPQDIVVGGTTLGKGWYGIEVWGGTFTRWMKNDARISLYSPENQMANLSLRLASFYRPRTLEIYIGNELAAVRGNISSTGFEDTTVPIHLANGTNTVRFQVPEGCERPCDKPELKNRDNRCLGLAFQKITIIP